MHYCAHCAKAFNSGKPKYAKSDEKEKKILVFCSEECMKMYG